jgi:hypothetical protein
MKNRSCQIWVFCVFLAFWGLSHSAFTYSQDLRNEYYSKIAKDKEWVEYKSRVVASSDQWNCSGQTIFRQGNNFFIPIEKDRKFSSLPRSTKGVYSYTKNETLHEIYPNNNFSRIEIYLKTKGIIERRQCLFCKIGYDKKQYNPKDKAQFCFNSKAAWDLNTSDVPLCDGHACTFCQEGYSKTCDCRSQALRLVEGLNDGSLKTIRNPGKCDLCKKNYCEESASVWKSKWSEEPWCTFYNYKTYEHIDLEKHIKPCSQQPPDVLTCQSPLKLTSRLGYMACE